VYELTRKAAANPVEIRSAKSLISDKENAAVRNDTTVPFLNPAFRDEMTDLIRAHAQTAIHQAVVAELEIFLGRHPGTRREGVRALSGNLLG